MPLGLLSWVGGPVSPVAGRPLWVSCLSWPCWWSSSGAGIGWASGRLRGAIAACPFLPRKLVAGVVSQLGGGVALVALVVRGSFCTYGLFVRVGLGVGPWAGPFHGTHVGPPPLPSTRAAPILGGPLVADGWSASCVVSVVSLVLFCVSITVWITYVFTCPKQFGLGRGWRIMLATPEATPPPGPLSTGLGRKGGLWGSVWMLEGGAGK